MTENKSLEDLLIQLHGDLVNDLLAKIRDKTATPKDLEIALKLLAHNNITSTTDTDPHLKELSVGVPFRT